MPLVSPTAADSDVYIVPTIEVGYILEYSVDECKVAVDERQEQKFVTQDLAVLPLKKERIRLSDSLELVVTAEKRDGLRHLEVFCFRTSNGHRYRRERIRG